MPVVQVSLSFEDLDVIDARRTSVNVASTDVYRAEKQELDYACDAGLLPLGRILYPDQPLPVTRAGMCTALIRAALAAKVPAAELAALAPKRGAAAHEYRPNELERIAAQEAGLKLYRERIARELARVAALEAADASKRKRK